MPVLQLAVLLRELLWVLSGLQELPPNSNNSSNSNSKLRNWPARCLEKSRLLRWY
jgi:hypothetical protein